VACQFIQYGPVSNLTSVIKCDLADCLGILWFRTFFVGLRAQKSLLSLDGNRVH